MAGVTLKDYVKHLSIPVELLDTTISDKHTQEVSRFLEWRRVAPYLKLDDSETEEVNLDGNNEGEKRYLTLKKWKRKFAFKATYKRLIEALLESGRADHAEDVCKLMTNLVTQKGVFKLASYTVLFVQTLRQLYNVLRPA